MEIECKYEVTNIPDNLEKYKSLKIEQGYICPSPIVRIRKSNEDYILTYKSKIGIDKELGKHANVVNEVEVPLSKEGYEHLRNKVDGNLITKTRYNIPIGNHLTAELDIFEGALSGLVFVEVEFAKEEDAKSFVPPIWFGKDVTFDKRYYNKYLSTIDKLW